MDYIHIENWREFQHYRDRNPPWIKLYVNLLDDYDYYSLPDNHKLILIHLWLLASKTNNNIPYDLQWIKKTLNLNIAIEIEPLIKAGFIWSDEEKIGSSKWSSRHIPKETKKNVREKCKDQCAICSSTESLEFDHIIPISKGGDSSEGNIQLLCQKCNRRKHACTTVDRQNVASVYQQSIKRRGEEKREDKTFFPLKPKKCHRTGCMKMGTIWDTDDTGLRYWMCGEHKKKGAKV